MHRAGAPTCTASANRPLRFERLRMARRLRHAVGMRMTASFIVATGLIAGKASADVPAWCAGAAADAPRVRDLSSQEPRFVLRAFVAAECHPTQEVEW